MRRGAVRVLAVVLFASFCSVPSAGLKEGVILEAGGKAIDGGRGHFVPCAVDWNQDGKKDLIAGQFDRGKIRLYLNQGTDSAPVFKDFSLLRAGDDEISLPAG